MANLLPEIFSSSSSEDEEPRPRQVFVRQNPFDEFDDLEFKRRFRLSKPSVVYILQLLGPTIIPKNQKNNPVAAMNQLLITLRYYATGTFQLNIGDFFNVSLPTVCRIVRRITHLIGRLRPQFIYLPRNRQEKDENVQTFFNIRGFPRTLGAVDCTHIKILSPGGNNAELFRNRKGYFSINVQAVCDANLKIMDIVARWPGSAHDMTIFNDSLLRARLEAREFGDTHLLGDNGYACRHYLLTPLLNPTTPAERRYNNSHIATRNTIERTFGVLKRRFPCLSIGMNLSIDTVLEIVVATAILHNICVIMGEDNPEEILDLGDEDEVLPLAENDDRNNAAVRTALINTIFA